MKQHFVDSSAFIAQSRLDDQYHTNALLTTDKHFKQAGLEIIK